MTRYFLLVILLPVVITFLLPADSPVQMFWLVCGWPAYAVVYLSLTDKRNK